MTKQNGRSKHELYPVWNSMNYRCKSKNHPRYEDYGGRGIKVCARWRGAEGFYNFIKDMGERPAGTSVDRIDNDKGYSPDNCRWVTAREQVFNTRSRLTESYDFSMIQEVF